MSNIIQVEGLKKSFGSIQAVRGIDLSVQKGSLYAFLGPNGAGKSTTIDILCTLTAADEGTAVIDGCVLGKDDAAIRARIGVVFQTGVLDDLLTVRENLLCRGSLYGVSKETLRKAVKTAAHAAGAEEFLDRPYGKLSGGQKRRADIARALVNTPSVLFLDEPTTGLDPKTKEEVWHTIAHLQKDTGMTVFLTTHYMEEAAMADYITIIDRGVIAAEGTPYALKEQYSSDRMCLRPADGRAELLLREKGIPYELRGGLISVRLRHTMDAVPLIELLREHMTSFEVVHGSMDDVFLNVTGGVQHE